MSVYNIVIMPNAIQTKQRINIILPVATVERLDRASEPGERSRLIDQAVRWYLHELARARLRREVKAGANARGERDQQLAQEWFAVESGL